jgi:hypothetical protein
VPSSQPRAGRGLGIILVLVVIWRNSYGQPKPEVKRKAKRKVKHEVEPQVQLVEPRRSPRNHTGDDDRTHRKE